MDREHVWTALQLHTEEQEIAPHLLNGDYMDRRDALKKADAVLFGSRMWSPIGR